MIAMTASRPGIASSNTVSSAPLRPENTLPPRSNPFQKEVSVLTVSCPICWVIRAICRPTDTPSASAASVIVSIAGFSSPAGSPEASSDFSRSAISAARASSSLSTSSRVSSGAFASASGVVSVVSVSEDPPPVNSDCACAAKGASVRKSATTSPVST